MKALIKKVTLTVGSAIMCANVAMAGHFQIQNLNIPQNVNGKSTGAHLQFDSQIFSVPIPDVGQTRTSRLPNGTYNYIFLILDESTQGSMISTHCNQKPFTVTDNTTLTITVSYNQQNSTLNCTSQ